MHKINNLFESIRIKFSEIIASYIATWKFIIIYTLIMITWVMLHKFGILHIDSEDFIRYNLFLSWAAGIQASIVLMTTNLQTEKDRKTLLKGIELDKETLSAFTKHENHTQQNVIKMYNKLTHLFNKMEKLEDIIGMMEGEEVVILNEKRKK